MRIITVCLGNICRSPAAEAVLVQRLARAGLSDRVSVTSAGTADYHVGERPDPTSVAEGERRGYAFTTRGVQLERAHLERADLVVVMDAENEREVRELAGTDDLRGRVVRLGAFSPDAAGGIRDVPDPWGGTPEDFAAMYDQVEEAVDGLVAAIRDGRVHEVVAAHQVV